MTPTLALTWMSGADDGKTFCVVADGSPPQVTLGRMATCAVSLPREPDASRQHARILWRDEQWWIEDLGSTNGTFLGEFQQSCRVTSPMALTPGRVFRLGRVRFRMEVPRSDTMVRQEQAQASCPRP